MLERGGPVEYLNERVVFLCPIFTLSASFFVFVFVLFCFLLQLGGCDPAVTRVLASSCTYLIIVFIYFFQNGFLPDLGAALDPNP
jgi:hypothetical protein